MKVVSRRVALKLALKLGLNNDIIGKKGFGR